MGNSRFSQYKFKFYLNASHSIYINGSYGERHPHTWEISILILKMRDEFIAFNYVEQEIEALLDKYQDKFLNDIAPFNTLNPTLENVCNFFKDEIRHLLNNKGWLLRLIEVGETPTRSYVINIFDDEIDERDERVEDYKGQQEHNAEEIAESIINNILKNK